MPVTFQSGQPIQSGVAYRDDPSTGYAAPVTDLDRMYMDMPTEALESLLDAQMRAAPMPALSQASEKERDLAVALIQSGIRSQAPSTGFEQAVGGLTGLPIAGMGQFVAGQMNKALQAGGSPIFDNGRLMGVVHDGLLGGRVYTGDPRFNPLATAAVQEEEQREVVMPVRDEMTSALKCPAGYVFDEQLQACRLDTSGPNIPAPTMATRGFYEMPYQSTGLLGDNYGASLIYG